MQEVEAEYASRQEEDRRRRLLRQLIERENRGRLPAAPLRVQPLPDLEQDSLEEGSVDPEQMYRSEVQSHLILQLKSREMHRIREERRRLEAERKSRPDKGGSSKQKGQTKRPTKASTKTFPKKRKAVVELSSSDSETQDESEQDLDSELTEDTEFSNESSDPSSSQSRPRKKRKRKEFLRTKEPQ